MSDNVNIKAKLVKGSFQVIKKQDEKTLIDFVMDELKDLDLSTLKLDPSFLQYLSELIENQVKKSPDDDKKSKPDKMDILVNILKKLFPSISTAEIDTAKKIVEFLLKEHLVKKVSLSKVMSYYLKKKFSW